MHQQAGVYSWYRIQDDDGLIVNAPVTGFCNFVELSAIKTFHVPAGNLMLDADVLPLKTNRIFFHGSFTLAPLMVYATTCPGSFSMNKILPEIFLELVILRAGCALRIFINA